jgi:hypothetical protein
MKRLETIAINATLAVAFFVVLADLWVWRNI